MGPVALVFTSYVSENWRVLESKCLTNVTWVAPVVSKVIQDSTSTTGELRRRELHCYGAGHASDGSGIGARQGCQLVLLDTAIGIKEALRCRVLGGNVVEACQSNTQTQQQQHKQTGGEREGWSTSA